MMLDNLAALAEVIGGIAVVVSLVYVGYQVKQNTVAIRTQVHETIVGHVLEAEGSLLHNADLAQIVVKAGSDPESLTPDERLRANTYFTHEYVNWESAFLHHKNGFVEDDMWRRWDLASRPDKKSPGQHKYWTEHRYWYDGEFARHVDTVFEELGHKLVDAED